MGTSNQEDWYSTSVWTWTPGSSTLPRIHLAQDHGRMPGGGSGARLISDKDGVRWVMKSHVLGGQQHGYLCLNEGLCGQVGRRLGLNVPEIRAVELTTDQLATLNAAANEADSIMVASRLIEPAEPLSPTAAADVSSTDLAGIVVFDALIWNTDRNEEHVLAQLQDERWRIFPIDHGNALAVASTLAGALDPLQPAHPPISLIRDRLTSDDLDEWIDRAQDITRKEFADMVHSMPHEWVTEPDAVDTLSDALFARAKQLKPALNPHFP
jgi:hypothetical protein